MTHENPLSIAVDPLLTEIAEYVADARIESLLAYEMARMCLADSLGCAMLALNVPACTKLLGALVPGAEMRGGARVPGTAYELDPVTAAFNIGCMIRWLDYNDTWLAAEWGHPSDNLGAILACADYVSRRNLAVGKPPLLMRDVLTAMIKVYEVQGILALDHAFNRVGLDHVLLVRVASTAVATQILGGSRAEIINALSNAWIDGGALRTYRHAPNTGSRKSWAAGDATSRAVRLALIALTGEMGYPTALSAKTWGFCGTLFRGEPIQLSRPLGTYVMENVLLKVFPAEFHAQTAVEAAIQLHPLVSNHLAEIDRICIETQEPAMRIINKTGPLRNPADRDHCLQYMVAVSLIHGTLKADDYEDEAGRNPRIEELRNKMEVVENVDYSRDYLDPAKRSVANAVRIFFKDGSATQTVEVNYPLGHPRRRKEAAPLLRQKILSNLAARFTEQRCSAIMEVFNEPPRLDCMPVDAFMQLLRVENCN